MSCAVNHVDGYPTIPSSPSALKPVKVFSMAVLQDRDSSLSFVDTFKPQLGHDCRSNVSSITIIKLAGFVLRTRRHANQGYVGLRIKEKIWVSTLPARKIRAVIPKINVSIVSIYNIIYYFIYYIPELRFTTAGHDAFLIVSVRVPSCPQTIP